MNHSLVSECSVEQERAFVLCKSIRLQYGVTELLIVVIAVIVEYLIELPSYCIMIIFRSQLTNRRAWRKQQGFGMLKSFAMQSTASQPLYNIDEACAH